jgi:transposase
VGEGMTVIMEKARFDRKQKGIERGDKVKVVFPPPYSSDFNPIGKE